MIVIDANVAMKWFIPEKGMKEAIALLRSNQKLVAPSIIEYEVVSGFVRRVRKEELSTGEATEHRNEWLRQIAHETIHLFDTSALLNPASELAYELRHPLYDCIYLALALKYGAPLVSADGPLIERANACGYKVYALHEVESILKA